VTHAFANHTVKDLHELLASMPQGCPSVDPQHEPRRTAGFCVGLTESDAGALVLVVFYESRVMSNTPYVVVVGLDFSEHSDGAFVQVVDLCRDRPRSEVHVVCVTSAYGPHVRLDMPDDVRTMSASDAESLLGDHVLSLRASHGASAAERDALAVTTHLRVGSAASEIVALADEVGADLIAIGANSRRGVRRLLIGSVARHVVRDAPCPVLMVRRKAHPAPSPHEHEYSHHQKTST
jgi:nucleotide-binding universal stress UspA family protein